MPDISDFDACDCGDYRHNHKNGTGACCFNDDNNGGLNHGFRKCMTFQFSRAADPNDPNVIRAKEKV